MCVCARADPSTFSGTLNSKLADLGRDPCCPRLHANKQCPSATARWKPWAIYSTANKPIQRISVKFWHVGEECWWWYRLDILDTRTQPVDRDITQWEDEEWVTFRIPFKSWNSSTNVHKFLCVTLWSWRCFGGVSDVWLNGSNFVFFQTNTSENTCFSIGPGLLGASFIY